MNLWLMRVQYGTSRVTIPCTVTKKGNCSDQFPEPGEFQQKIFNRKSFLYRNNYKIFAPGYTSGARRNASPKNFRIFF